MKYIVKLRKTITLEYRVEVDADSVVNAMDQAEASREAKLASFDLNTIADKAEWAVVSVQTKE